MQTHNTVTDLALLLARVPLGAYFAIAGYNKIAGPGVGGFVSMQIETARQFMPEGLAKAYLGALPLVELLVGAALVVGVLVRVNALLATLMLVSFVMAVGGPAFNIEKIVSSGSSEPFNKNLVFLGLGFGLTLLGGGRLCLDRLAMRRTSASGKANA
jgi:uncharacterized membrane protein YphA (DoxX/SURF4 family)